MLSDVKRLTSMRLQVVLEPSEEGGYTIFVPSLPGCISEGENIDDALSNIHEAIELYLESTEDNFSLVEGAIIQEVVL